MLKYSNSPVRSGTHNADFSCGPPLANSQKGIHEVQARKFCLVAADHPLVSAISENAEKLQMGEISMMCASHQAIFCCQPDC